MHAKGKQRPSPQPAAFESSGLSFPLPLALHLESHTCDDTASNRIAPKLHPSGVRQKPNGKLGAGHILELVQHVTQHFGVGCDSTVLGFEHLRTRKPARPPAFMCDG